MEEGYMQGPMIKKHIYHHFKKGYTKRQFRLLMREDAWTANTNLGELEDEF